LIPGMTLSAEIKVGSRRAITFFVYPLVKGFGESLREP
jgi:HlyD family secretion protein